MLKARIWALLGCMVVSGDLYADEVMCRPGTMSDQPAVLFFVHPDTRSQDNPEKGNWYLHDGEGKRFLGRCSGITNIRSNPSAEVIPTPGERLVLFPVGTTQAKISYKCTR